MKNYKIEKVLKSNKKFLILKCQNNFNKEVILKISLLESNTLEREFERLINLSNYSDENITYVKPLVFSKFIEGPFKSLYYYEQEFIRSSTFSKKIRECKLTDYDHVNNLFRPLEKNSYKISEVEHHSSYISTNISLFSLINDYLEFLSNSFFYKNLFSQDCIIFKNYKLKNLEYSINLILKSKKYKEFVHKPLKMVLSHANYHGDNLLPSDNGIKIIDPDVSIPIVPRSFALARFIYTFVHDSADYGDYDVFTKWFSHGEPIFDFKSNIPNEVTNSYKKIFGDLLDFNDEKFMIFDNLNYFSSNELKLSYLFCLLRGIKANQSNINFSNNNGLDFFQEKGLFIYLNCIKYVNWLLKEI